MEQKIGLSATLYPSSEHGMSSEDSHTQKADMPRKTGEMTVETPPATLTTCPLCGAPLNATGDECTKCDWVPGYRRQHDRREQVLRNPRDVASALLSIVPGAGHIFKGHQIGWLFMTGIPVIIVMAFAFTMFFGWLLVPTYWIAVAVDAYLKTDLRVQPAPAVKRET